MSIWEFDQELHDQAMREDGEVIGVEKGIEIGKTQGIEIGKTQGIEIGSHIFHQITAGNTNNESLAAACGCTLEEVEIVRRQFGI